MDFKKYIFKPEKGYYQEKKLNCITLCHYNYEKINDLFKNFDTMSFLDIIINYKNFIMVNNKIFLKQSTKH